MEELLANINDDSEEFDNLINRIIKNSSPDFPYNTLSLLYVKFNDIKNIEMVKLNSKYYIGMYEDLNFNKTNSIRISFKNKCDKKTYIIFVNTFYIVNAIHFELEENPLFHSLDIYSTLFMAYSLKKNKIILHFAENRHISQNIIVSFKI